MEIISIAIFKKKTDKLSKKLKAKANHFGTTTTAHGISKLIESESLLIRLIWFVAIIASVSFGLYNIASSVNDYYNYDVITNVERVKIYNMTFPAVTFCSRDRYFQVKGGVRAQVSNLSIRDFIAYDKSYFRGSLIDMSALEFFKITDYKGDCVRFNGGPENLETVISPSDSLDFKINTLISDSENNKSYEMTSIAFNVYLDSNNLISYLDIIPLKADMNLYHGIDVAKTESQVQLPFPYNNCSVRMDKTYLQQNCVERCIIDEVRDMYNCSLPSYYTFKASDYCKDEEPTKYPSLIKDLYDSCKRSCSKECEGERFSSQIVWSRELEGNLTRFEIKVSDFSTLEITQIPKMNSFSLISNVGGLLGISLGLSLLSFVEIVDLFIEIVCIILC